MNAEPIYLISASINEAMVHWAQTLYPQYQQSFGAKSRSESYLIGRAMLEYALHELYQINYPPRLSIEKHGKPYLNHPSAPNFNLSHSDCTIILSLGYHRRMGVDIEVIQERGNFPGLLTRTFTEHEIEWIKAQADFKEAFFWLWSAKEAYLKADGRGLSGLNLMEIYPDRETIEGPLEKGSLLITTYQSQSLALYTQYYAHEALKTYHLNDEGLLSPSSLNWRLILKDSSSLDDYDSVPGIR